MIGKFKHRWVALAFVASLLLAPSCFAADANHDQKLNKCLEKASQYPDMAVADAEAWMKTDGGDAARLCRANGLYNRGDFDAAGREFSALASKRSNNLNAASLYQQAALAFAQAKETKNAEILFGKALKLQPDDAEIWFSRAVERASVERYWEAIDDLNHALKIMPRMAKALRLRGQSWMHLGNTKNAKSDFYAAEDIEGIKHDPEPAKPDDK